MLTGRCIEHHSCRHWWKNTGKPLSVERLACPSGRGCVKIDDGRTDRWPYGRIVRRGIKVLKERDAHDSRPTFAE